jgi:Tfp pilus assembly protein FimT
MKKKLCALTLIELMITVGILAIFSAVSIPLVVNNKKTQAIRSESTLVQGFISKAKSLAQNPESADAIGYAVVEDSPSQLHIDRLEENQSIALDEKLRISQSSIVNNFAPIKFKTFSGELFSDSGTNPPNISIVLQSLSDSSNQKTITIKYPGAVNVN